MTIIDSAPNPAPRDDDEQLAPPVAVTAVGCRDTVCGTKHEQQLRLSLDEALRPLFGDNLERYYAEVERHDAEARELQDRARRVANSSPTRWTG